MPSVHRRQEDNSFTFRLAAVTASSKNGTQGVETAIIICNAGSDRASLDVTALQLPCGDESKQHIVASNEEPNLTDL